MKDSSTVQMTVGVDVGDVHSWLCVLNAEGEVVEVSRLATKEAALKPRFAAMARARVVLEVGTHSPWMDRLLRSLGHEVIVANPRKLGLITQSKKKSDRNDAEMLARLGRLDPELLSPVKHRSEQTQADLAVLRARDVHVSSRTQLISHVRGAVKTLGGRIPKMDADYFDRKAGAHVPEELKAALLPVIDTIAYLTRQIKDAEVVMEALVEERYPVAKFLQRVPRVGLITSFRYVLTIEDPQRFQRSRDAGPFIGLTPGQRQSGERNPQLHISKAGDPKMRRDLVQVAQQFLGPKGPDCDLRTWGLKLAERGGAAGKKRAVVAVARKLAVLLHHLWITGEVYRPHRLLPGETPQEAAAA
jgi:transposase